MRECSLSRRDLILENLKFLNLSPQDPKGRARGGESRGSNIGDSGRDTWMDRHRWEVDVGTSPHPDPRTLPPRQTP